MTDLTCRTCAMACRLLRRFACAADSLVRSVDDCIIADSRPQWCPRAPVLVWCWHCGTSYEWPWGRCVYVCERCGGHQIGALEPGEVRP